MWFLDTVIVMMAYRFKLRSVYIACLEVVVLYRFCSNTFLAKQYSAHDIKNVLSYNKIKILYSAAIFTQIVWVRRIDKSRREAELLSQHYDHFRPEKLFQLYL